MKRILYLVLLIASLPAHGQISSVTATLTDSDAVTWNSGTCTMLLVQPQYPPVIAKRIDNGSVVPTTPACTVSVSGVLSTTVTDVGFIAPANSKWQFKVCPNVSSGGTGCGVTLLSIHGSSQSVTGQLNLPPPRVGGGVGSFAYADVEVAPLFNNFYQNTVLGQCRSWTGSWGTCASGGAGATLPTNAIVYGLSSTTSRAAVGSRDGSGDYQQPITVVGMGGGLSCALVGSQWQCTQSGGGLTGAVASGGPYQVGGYTATGTTIGPLGSLHSPPAGLTAGQLNTLLSGSGLGVILHNGRPGLNYVNTNHNFVFDMSMAVPVMAWPVTSSGAACDTLQITGQFSSSTTTITGHAFTAADIGKTVQAVAPNGSGLPTRYIAMIQSVSGGNAVMPGNSPFSTSSGWTFTLGHDDNAAIVDALGFSNSTGIALTLPEGICYSSAPLPYQGQSISGQSSRASGLLGPAGEDTLIIPDLSQGGSSGIAGGHLHDFTIYFDSEIDASDSAIGNNSAIWSACTAAGCANRAGLYRPVGIGDGVANNPVNAQWIQGAGPYSTGAINGVASVGGSGQSGTPSNSVICLPAAYPVPAISSPIIFPYQGSAVAMFQSSVSSHAGSCTTGNPVTMADAWTAGSVAAGAPATEWFSGTSFQTIQSTVPATGRSWPMTITLGRSIIPDPEFARAGFAPYGVVQVGAEQFTYFGTSNKNAGTSPTVTLTSSIQNGTGATGTLHSIGATAFPLNPISPSLPWPANPPLVGGSTTPTGAEFYPANGIGSAGIAAPIANGNGYGGASALSQATWEHLSISSWPIAVGAGQNPISFQLQNDTAGLYLVPLPFNSHFTDVLIVNPYYGIAEGTPATNTHGYFTRGFPTADENRWTGITVHSACYDLWTIGEGSGIWAGSQVFSQCGQPPNHLWPQFTTAYSGAMGAWYMGGPYDDQNDQMGYNSVAMVDTHFDGHYLEAETSGSPTLAGTAPLYQLDCANCAYTSFTPKSGGLTYIGGSYQILEGGFLSGGATIPVINYGRYNSFERVAGLSNTGQAASNVWGACSFCNWGPGTYASTPASGTQTGAIQVIAAGNSKRRLGGQTADTFATGNLANWYADPLGGYVTPDEFNTSSSFDPNPMSVGWVFDDSAPISHSYTACNVPTSGGCSTYQFNSGARVQIGPDQRISAAPYLMSTAFKTPAGANTFTFTVSTRNASGTCSTSTPYSATITTTGSGWQLFPPPGAAPIPVDFSGSSGCVLQVAYQNAGSASQVQTAFVDFTPIPANSVATQFTFPGGINWSYGSGAPSSTCPSAGVPVGSVYSNSAGSPNAFYVCQSGGWTGK